MVFGIDLVRHDEAGVDDDRGFLQHFFDYFEFFDAGQSKEQLGSKGPAWGIRDIVGQEGVGFEEVGVEEREAEFLREELAGGGFATPDRADEGNLVIHIRIIKFITVITVILFACS